MGETFSKSKSRTSLKSRNSADNMPNNSFENLNNLSEKLVEDIVNSSSKKIIKDKNKYNNIKLDQILKMSLQASESKIKLSANEKSFPVMLSLKETELDNNKNENEDNENEDNEDDTTVDLFCVIDRSGSMSGERLSVLKQSLKYCLELLKPTDRISLIQFDNYSQIL